MKRFIPLALTVLALAAVPAAFADNGSTPPVAGPAPTAQQGQPASGQGAANIRARIEILRLRMQLVELRFAKRCGSNSAKAPQACLDFAKKVEDRLTKLDGNIQARIAKIQQTCGTASTDAKCKNADKRIALLQAIDTRVTALAQKVQDWLDGKTVSSPDPSSDSSLDQAAAGLGQLTQQAGTGK
jgi:hypothetical protein